MSRASLKLVFMGTPDFSVEALKALLVAGHDVVCVYSQPPRKAGRGQKLTPTPVHAYAEAQGIEVRTPVSLKSPEA
ncbi:MAG TPA: methionyl-tRNA formyltransferase, partial [Magnetovibrio sp.]